MRDGFIFEIGRVMTTFNDFRLKTLIRLDRSHANKKLISNTPYLVSYDETRPKPKTGSQTATLTRHALERPSKGFSVTQGQT